MDGIIKKAAVLTALCCLINGCAGKPVLITTTNSDTIDHSTRRPASEQCLDSALERTKEFRQILPRISYADVALLTSASILSGKTTKEAAAIFFEAYYKVHSSTAKSAKAFFSSSAFSAEAEVTDAVLSTGKPIEKILNLQKGFYEVNDVTFSMAVNATFGFARIAAENDKEVATIVPLLNEISLLQMPLNGLGMNRDEVLRSVLSGGAQINSLPDKYKEAIALYDKAFPPQVRDALHPFSNRTLGIARLVTLSLLLRKSIADTVTDIQSLQERLPERGYSDAGLSYAELILACASK